MSTPIIMAKAKSWMMPPPRTNSVIRTIRVVKDVRIVRPRVSLMLVLRITSRRFLWCFLKFSRMRSNTMIVSLRE